MGIESGPSGAIGLAGTAPVAVGNFSTIVNEGPVRGSLEGFKPMNASDINTIDFKGGTIAPSQPSVIQQAEAVAAAVWEKSELIPQQEVVLPVVLPAALPQVEPAPVLQVSPALEPVAKTGLSPKLEARVSHQVARAVSPQPLLQEQEEEEEVLEKVEHEESKDSLEEEEEIEQTNRKFVVDERALSQVVLEIKAAVRKAGVLAGKLGIRITGKLIGSFLPAQHPGNESEAVKGKGPDGSIPERQQTIEEQGEFISVVQAEEDAVLVAYEKPPIQIRPEGEPVKDEDVDRVFRAHVAKPKAVAVEITRKRVVKKQTQALAGQAAVETKPETSLADFPKLAEVFQKAA